MSREKLAKLRKKVKRKLAFAVVDGFVEQDGDTLRVFTRSHRLHAEWGGWLDREFGGGVTGEEMMLQCFPGVKALEFYGPHGLELELGSHDRLIREVVEDPDLQRVMKTLGGSLVGVKPLKKKRGPRV